MEQLFILILIGAVAGIASGLLGVGGAVIVIPALMYFLHYSQHEAQGTTLAMMLLPIGGLAAWQYYQLGYVQAKSALVLAVSFFVFGWVGAKLSIYIPEDWLKKAFAVFLILLGIKLLWGSK